MHTYETDFSAWADEQSQALAEKRLSELDFTNLAEEIASLGRSEKSALGNQIRRLIMHLLKWRAQPYDRSSSWIGTIDNARDEIEYLLEDNPSLRNKTNDLVRNMYRRSVKDAIKETGMKQSDFPEECPFTFEELMTFPASKDELTA